jgi:hypothetical protein
VRLDPGDGAVTGFDVDARLRVGERLGFVHRQVRELDSEIEI